MPGQESGVWDREYQARFGATPGRQKIEAEFERAVELGKSLLEERDLLRADLARVEAERDQYLRALATRIASELPPIDLDRDALAAQTVQHPTLEQLLQELEHEGK